MNRERTKLLIGRYLDRELSVEEMAELQAVMRTSAEARELFWDDAQWHALFRQWGEQEWGRQAVTLSPETPPVTLKRPVLAVVRRPDPRIAARRKVVSIRRWAVSTATIAAAVVLFLGIRAHLPVATLERQANGEWSVNGIQSGDRLRPGLRHRLDAGIAVISFDSPARALWSRDRRNSK